MQPTYTITDQKALFEQYPSFFKVDHAKIRKAISIDIVLPGVTIDTAAKPAAAPKKTTPKLLKRAPKVERL